jgi:hypothetical protein
MIRLPRAKVCELFNNPEHWDKWQESLVRYEPIGGTPGSPGAKTKLIHKFGNKTVEMVETVELQGLPAEMVCVYEAPSAWNRVVYRFKELSPEKTGWEFETDFNCRGFLKVLAFFMLGMFKSATKKDMDAFKAFAESAAEG